MITEVFIGDLESEDFNYEGGDWSGNLPKRISEFLPMGRQSFDYILQQISNNNIEGRQTDWGTWVSVMYTNEIENFFNNLYDQNAKSVLRQILSELDKDQYYALVACEIG